MKFKTSHAGRIRIPVRGGNARVKATEIVQHGNDRLPKKRKARK